MHHGGLLGYMGESKKVTFEDLKKEFDSIKNDIHIIETMAISSELKPPILEELSTQLEEVRGKMHDYIDIL